MKVLVALVHQPGGSLRPRVDDRAGPDHRLGGTGDRLAENLRVVDGNGRWVEPGVTGQRYGGVMSSSLDLKGLKAAATEFAESLRGTPIPELFGTTDGKALGTWVEASFNKFLAERHAYSPGNAARGIDFPELEVDLKATLITQPQSSCPFRDASQKIFGLGYDLLVFVYEKTDTQETQSAAIDVRHALFIDRSRTGDYQTTRGILEISTAAGMSTTSLPSWRTEICR